MNSVPGFEAATERLIDDNNDDVTLGDAPVSDAVSEYEDLMGGFDDTYKPCDDLPKWIEEMAEAGGPMPEPIRGSELPILRIMGSRFVLEGAVETLPSLGEPSVFSYSPRSLY